MKFRKKPIVIEAYQLGVGDAVPDWFMDALSEHRIITHGGKYVFATGHNAGISATIKTLEGEMRAEYTEMIIKGVQEERYPCRSDIFEATYDAVDHQEQQ